MMCDAGNGVAGRQSDGTRWAQGADGLHAKMHFKG